MTTRLGQQELMAPTPSRTVLVRAGCTAWWGVDPSSKRIALAGVATDGFANAPYISRWQSTEPFPARVGAERLSHIYRLTKLRVMSHAACVTWPGIVLVEQPSGAQVSLELRFATGVIITAIHDGLQDVCGMAPAIELVTPAWWKKRSVGRGDIYKPKRGDGREYGVLTWARDECGYRGSSWDEADAVGIAEAARRTIRLEERGVQPS